MPLSICHVEPAAHAKYQSKEPISGSSLAAVAHYEWVSFQTLEAQVPSTVK